MRNDYSDYLMHRDHKYLSREWVKGKWNYIYDNKLGGNQKKALSTAKTNEYNAKSRYNSMQKRPAVELKNNNIRMFDENRRVEAASSIRESKQKDYDKTILGKIDKGKKLVDKMLGGAISKAEQKKSDKNQAELKTKRESGYVAEAKAKTDKQAAEVQKARENKRTESYAQNEKSKTDKFNISNRERNIGAAEKKKTEAKEKEYVENYRTNATDKQLKAANDKYYSAMAGRKGYEFEMEKKYGKNWTMEISDEDKKTYFEKADKEDAANKERWDVIEKDRQAVGAAEAYRQGIKNDSKGFVKNPYSVSPEYIETITDSTYDENKEKYKQNNPDRNYGYSKPVLANNKSYTTDNRPRSREKNETDNGVGITKKNKAKSSYRIRQR